MSETGALTVKEDMQKWAYITVEAHSRTELDETLQKYGNEGWELVTVTALTGIEKKRAGQDRILGLGSDRWIQWDMFFKRLLSPPRKRK